MASNRGFTLIELSIVLVIIGLIVAGVVVGQSLITSASARAQVAQIDKFNAAAYTFKGKYRYFPGDILNEEGEKFGLSTTLYWPNGDGLIVSGFGVVGETGTFWAHLSEARLIEGTFSPAYVNMAATGTQIANYLPPAKLGGQSYVYVWSGGPDPCQTASSCVGQDGFNYFSVNDVLGVCNNGGCGFAANLRSVSNMAVSIAHAIDSKADDGLPQSGRIKAFYLDTGTTGFWSGPFSAGGLPSTDPYAGSSTTCYDNGNVTGPMKYSVSQNNGTGRNCALSFRF